MNTFEFLYKEYIRLHNIVESYAKSSFEDFKLLGVIGLMLAWEPLQTKVANNSDDSSLFLFFGFIAILLVLAIIATRDLMKMSIILFYLEQMKTLEKKMPSSSSINLSLDLAKNCETWFKTKHRSITTRFTFFFYALVITIPVSSICRSDGKQALYLAIVYFVISCIVILIYANTSKILFEKN